MTRPSQSSSQLQLRVSAAAGNLRDALTTVNARRDLECIYCHSTRLKHYRGLSMASANNQTQAQPEATQQDGRARSQVEGNGERTAARGTQARSARHAPPATA